jgi:endoribonuclease LACTB2
MATKVRVAGSGVICAGERVLLARRHPESRFFGGFFSFVGGAVEAYETPLEAVIREIEEEVGLVLGSTHAPVEAGVLTTPPFSPIRFETHFYAFSEVEPAEARLMTEELDALRWETPAEWLRLWRSRELRIPPPVLHVLRILEQGGLTAGSWARCRDEALAFERADQPRLHRIEFEPGVVMAPLETPTLPPATTTNCLLIGAGHGVVVDPASTAPSEHARLDALIAELEFEPRAVVLTHHHEDHSAGAWSFAERWQIPMLGHPETASRVQGCAGDLTEGVELAVGGDVLRVLETPGHARGHICLYSPAARSCVGGDMISTVSTILIDPPEGHMGTYLRSIERLAGLELDILYPAHGPPSLRPAALLAHYLEHRRAREEKVYSATGTEPRPLDAIVRLAYDDVDERLWPLARRSALAHLVHLDEQGRLVAQGGERWQRR